MSDSQAKSYTLQQLADVAEAQVEGDPELLISGLGTLETASAGDISFLANPNYEKLLCETQASAVIMSSAKADKFNGSKLLADNPYAAFARITHLFDLAPEPQWTIHPTAVVHENAVLADKVSIGAHAIIECGAEIGEECVVGAGAFIGENSKLAAKVKISPNVTIYHGVSIGEGTIIHASSVIGADGFGFAPHDGGWIKIHQVGGVRIGKHTEIGSSTTVDRGAINDTVIGDSVIIDNQVQIGHNVELGDGTAVVAQAGVSGSTKVGKNCILAGRSGLVGHIEIADGTTVSAFTMVTKSITEPGVYTGAVPFEKADSWRRNATRFRQLDSLAKRISSLEKKLKS